MQSRGTALSGPGVQFLQLTQMELDRQMPRDEAAFGAGVIIITHVMRSCWKRRK